MFIETQKIKEEDPLLKSLLYCYHCHNRLQIRKKQEKYKDTVKIRRYIYCSTASRKVSNQTCYNQYINYDRFEKEVLEKISEIFEEYLNSEAFDNNELLDNLIKSQSNKGRLEEKLNQINEQLNVINKKISTLYNDRLNELIEEQDYRMFSENMIKERKKLEELQLSTRKEINEFNKNADNKELQSKLKNIIKKVVEQKELKKEDIQQLVNKIEIDKDKNVLIHFNFYELNCMGGYIKYGNNRNNQAVNS